MTNEEFQAFLEQVGHDRLVDYLSPTRWETPDEALRLRQHWAEKHKDHPDHSSEAGFLLAHTEALSAKLIDECGDQVEQVNYGSGPIEHDWGPPDESDCEDSQVLRLRATYSNLAKDRPVRPEHSAFADDSDETTAPAHLTRMEDLTDPPADFRQGTDEQQPLISTELRDAIIARNTPEYVEEPDTRPPRATSSGSFTPAADKRMTLTPSLGPSRLASAPPMAANTSAPEVGERATPPWAIPVSGLIVLLLIVAIGLFLL